MRRRRRRVGPSGSRATWSLLGAGGCLSDDEGRPQRPPLRRRPPGLPPPPVSEQPARVAIARLCHVGPGGRGPPHAAPGTSPRVSTKHPAQDERGRFEELAEQASNFTSSPAFFAGCALVV